MAVPRDPTPPATVEQLITGGIAYPPTANDVIRGGAPGGSADAVMGDLGNFNGGSLSTFDLDQLYSESLQKVLGVGIGYSSNPGEMYSGFSKPIAMPTGRDWVSAYYADPVNWNIALRLSGYYRGKDDPRLGLKSESYVTSFGQLLTDAALSRKTITQMLQGTPQQYAELVRSGKVNLDALARSGAGRAKAKQPIRYSGAEDLKEQARAAALDTLGYVPDDGFLGDFVKLYHGMEGGFQKKMYAGASATEPGNPQVLAAKELREDYQTEASSYSTVKAFDDFLSVIGAQQGVAGGS